MATISELLKTIETATYGKDLRTALAEAIKILNEELSNISETTGGDTTSNATPYTLPVASADTLGGIKIGNNLTVNDDGTLNFGNYTQDDVLKFLMVNLDKEIEPVDLLGTNGMFKIGDNGLELSLFGRIDVARIIYDILLITQDALNTSMDDMAQDLNTFSYIITLSDTCNSELYELFGRNASLGFLTILSYTEGNTIYITQIVHPIATDGAVPPVATRSKIGDADWGEWSTLSGASGADIETVDLGIESDVSLDNLITEKNLYSGFTSIIGEQNSELYELYGGNISVVFISTRNFKATDSEDPEDSEIFAIYSRQTAYPFFAIDEDLNFPNAYRLGIYVDGNTMWSKWQFEYTNSTGSGETDTEIAIPSIGEFAPNIGTTGLTQSISKKGNNIKGYIKASISPDDPIPKNSSYHIFTTDNNYTCIRKFAGNAIIKIGINSYSATWEFQENNRDINLISPVEIESGTLELFFDFDIE